LIGLKEKLRVGGAVEKDQLLWFRSFLELAANGGEARTIVVGVFASDEEDDAVDLPWP
jgi:hypothetical protein